MSTSPGGHRALRFWLRVWFVVRQDESLDPAVEAAVEVVGLVDDAIIVGSLVVGQGHTRLVDVEEDFNCCVVVTFVTFKIKTIGRLEKALLELLRHHVIN